MTREEVVGWLAQIKDRYINGGDEYYDDCRKEAIDTAIEALKQPSEWKDASKRPPKNGRYLVWGLQEFTPDHCDMPNAYWQTRIATWFNNTGWDTKVKYWRELPEPPEEKQ